jgi:hypothetical protein
MEIEQDKHLPLCLDCSIRYQNMINQQLENIERQINFAMDTMDDVIGIYGVTPRFPERRPLIHTGGVTLNNINVSNSEIGVLNTGTIENVDSTVTVLKTEGNNQLASAVTALSEAIIKSDELSNEQKNETLELLSSLSSEAIAPKKARKLGVVRALLSGLSGMLGDVATLSAVWEKVQPVFQQVFGI